VRSAAEFAQRVIYLEGLGFDVLIMPDHVASVAPYPALVAAAEATSTMRLGTCVLNAGFYNPALPREMLSG
jgi:alkanesulfonate monooxygenase SsuD/methylene tetrahydromethanopterin reductase-like flavin-dependent oxidoreductase (luciferase family)